MKSQTYLNKIKSFFKKNAGKEVTRYQMIQIDLTEEESNVGCNKDAA